MGDVILVFQDLAIEMVIIAPTRLVAPELGKQEFQCIGRTFCLRVGAKLLYWDRWQFGVANYFQEMTQERECLTYPLESQFK